MKVGYARVSTLDQNLDAQIESLQADGCEKVFCEKVSGASKNRPEFAKMCESLAEGDVVVTTKMDRLFRSTGGALNQLDDWTNKGILFTCLDQPLMSTNDTSPTGELFRQMLLAFAQFERSLIKERTAEGRARAKAAGQKMGRKRKLSKAQVEHALEQFEQGKSMRELSKLLRVDRTTLWRRITELQSKRQVTT